jgi:ADP-ribosylglycohydrolase
MDTRTNRALGALLGGALGDAMGMPSQTLTRAQIAARYGRITGLVAPYAGHPVSHGLKAAQVTDDTEQTLLLAGLVVASPDVFDALSWAQALLAWEADVQARGLLDLLGPSSKRALLALLAGESIEQTGRAGTTNGAAMRIAPVGIATMVEPLSALVDQVEAACRVTHNTAEAISAAAAVAAVISAGVQGATFEQAIPLALAAARLGAGRGYLQGDVDMAGRIQAALDLAATGPDVAAFAEAIGTSVASHHAIPAAFGVLRMAGGDVWAAAIMAANIGDDTDTIGAIACGMAGACAGADALPVEPVAKVIQANGLNVLPIVQGLLRVRDHWQGAI